MQKTKLLSGPEIAHTVANFPALLMAIREADVTAGDGTSNGVAGTGQIIDPVSGAVFTPSVKTTGVFKPGPAGTFGTRVSTTVWPKTAGVMPTIGMKHPLMIVVRHAVLTSDQMVVLGDANACSLVSGNSGWIANTAINYGQLGAITFSAGIRAMALSLDRSVATASPNTDANASKMIVATETSTQAVAGSSDGDAIDANLRDTTFPILPNGLRLDGTATSANNNIYGIYLLAFNSPGALQSAWLTKALQWMARNPTKGLYPLFAGLA